MWIIINDSAWSSLKVRVQHPQRLFIVFNYLCRQTTLSNGCNISVHYKVIQLPKLLEVYVFWLNKFYKFSGLFFCLCGKSSTALFLFCFCPFAKAIAKGISELSSWPLWNIIVLWKKPCLEKPIDLPTPKNNCDK